MCGICGIYDFDGRDVRRIDLRNMAKQMIHRGPDDEGEALFGHSGIAMRRLSIIDLTRGHQPIYNEDKKIVVVANGEIYNYIELSEDLKKKGHDFYTNSDTEVLVHLYEEYGEEMMAHINGMFAFAIWDNCKKEMFLARDRLGIKQLYYYHKKGKFVFASDIRSFFVLPWFERKPEWKAITDYLTFLYIPASLTAFEDVFSLPPATLLRVNQSGVFPKTYWSINRHIKSSYFRNEKEIIAEFGYLLEDSVRMRLRSDVPVGIFLSGGLDSSTLTAFVTKIAGKSLRSYSVGFDGNQDCELKAAKSISEYCGTIHSELRVTYEDILSELPNIVWHMAQPIGDSAAVPSYHVSKLASNNVKVLLNGAGGDELMAGYLRHHLPSLVHEVIKMVPAFFIDTLGFFSQRAKDVNFFGKVQDYTFTKNLFLSESVVFSSNIVNRISRYLPDRLHEHKFLYEDIGNQQKNRGFINRLCALDCRVYLPDDVLFLLDRTTMAQSIEGRVPLLDHRIVELMQNVPVSMKIRNGQRKAFLRKMMSGRLPESILQNNKKQGFSGPVETWKNKGLFEICKKLILSPEAKKRDFWNEETIKWLFKNKDNITGQQVWMLLILEIWMRIFFDTNPLEKPSINLLKY